MKPHIPLPHRFHYSDETRLEKAIAFNEQLQKRRTVRHFTEQKVDKAVISQCILAAGSAPSGANMQPWTFVAVSNQNIKQQIRQAAEAEEREFYQHRASQEWLKALEPLGTDTDKPFLEKAPWLIAVFAQRYGVDEQGNRIKHYYTPESVGIACGFLINALHNCGLATLTHTPSPMGFLKKILKRPQNERPFLLIVCGHAAKDAKVPNLQRKKLAEIAKFL